MPHIASHSITKMNYCLTSPKDVDEDRAHVVVAVDDLQPIGDDSGVGAAAQVGYWPHDPWQTYAVVREILLALVRKEVHLLRKRGASRRTIARDAVVWYLAHHESEQNDRYTSGMPVCAGPSSLVAFGGGLARQLFSIVLLPAPLVNHVLSLGRCAPYFRADHGGACRIYWGAHFQPADGCRHTVRNDGSARRGEPAIMIAQRGLVRHVDRPGGALRRPRLEEHAQERRSQRQEAPEEREFHRVGRRGACLRPRDVGV